MTSFNALLNAASTLCPPTALRFEGVAFSHLGETLLGPCSFTLTGPGPTLVMGPNGAGKSILLRLAHGLLSPTQGQVSWSGEGRPRQAMVFQNPVLLRRSAVANLTHALAVNNIPRKARRKLAVEALERFGLTARAATPARVLSGGEQQRLALARAWVLAPAVLFLDEPTSALDPAAIKAVETAVREFHQRGTRIVMTTHDLHQAKRLAGDVLFLAGGKIKEHTLAESFFSSPASKEARAFIAGELVE
ncbi:MULTISPECIES: ATP-binding cassette domain-containing protein [unclassified Marinobacter]|uniref:ATP-binding cassette domain-containing protein n=1 Tax=unclassified Marinobacter TaxID=83889 RepID=UPI000BF29BE5|nr:MULTISPECIES: ATP-binding cassette domain-containing protein [unclassified Marinobacter]PFG11107.1 amino acid ABC transporter ATP-binding protein (PAAT family) [Marinobacter sp. LV10MA510-1]PFG52999.1 amino acid ABC transporter ATP-binding protein (PAAT family) [Marinobacter sp. LV10R520-4]